MRHRTDRWVKLAARGRFQMEAKARIGGVDYTKISAPKIDRSLMSSPLSVGNCTSATLSLSILTDDEIKSASPVVIMGRLTDGNIFSEWMEFGTFFIDQRDTSIEGLVTIDCYDAMLKANKSYLDGSDSSENWPKTMKAVVEEIAYRIGVGIDPRTKINTGADYVVPYPSGKSMIQVLGDIGACHGGNWIITEENLLRLVPLVTAPDETFHVISHDYDKIKTSDGNLLIYKEQEIFNAVLPAPTGETPKSVIPLTHYITDEHGNAIITPDGHYLVWAANGSADAVDGLINIPVVCGKITTGMKVTITGVSMENDGGESYTAGDDSGAVLTIESNPYATQGICDALYAAFNGLVYFPYTATKALYDPATELGDQVKIGDMVYSVLYTSTLDFDLNFRSDISAPNSAELSEEYPYLSEAKKLECVVASSTAKTLSSAKTYVNDMVSRIKLEATNKSNSSVLRILRDGEEISRTDISFSDVVAFDDLSTEGRSTINGCNIKTGTIDATQVTLSNAEYGGFCCSTGNDGASETCGAKVYGSAGPDAKYYVFVSNAGAMMRAGSSYLYCIDGAVRASSEIVVTSDRRAKQDVSYELKQYEAFFKQLKPATFLLNEESDKKWHLGFVAQDVERALDTCGLRSKKSSLIDVSEFHGSNGSTSKTYGLRYSEFIALNTYIIQSLIKRVERLEATNKQTKNRR